MCVKFRFFKMKSWKDSVTIKCCLLCKGRTIYYFTSMKWVQSICFVCSISRACQRLKKLQGLELKISAIRIVLTFFMSIWLKFSVLCKPFHIKSEWFSASCRWSTLEMGSRVALPMCRKVVEALQQEPQVSARLLGCPGGIVSPSFSLNMHHTAAQAVHKPRGEKEIQLFGSCILLGCCSLHPPRDGGRMESVWSRLFEPCLSLAVFWASDKHLVVKNQQKHKMKPLFVCNEISNFSWRWLSTDLLNVLF